MQWFIPEAKTNVFSTVVQCKQAISCHYILLFSYSFTLCISQPSMPNQSRCSPLIKMGCLHACRMACDVLGWWRSLACGSAWRREGALRAPVNYWASSVTISAGQQNTSYWSTQFMKSGKWLSAPIQKSCVQIWSVDQAGGWGELRSAIFERVANS